MRPLVISRPHSAGGLPAGTCNSGMGPATNRRRQGLASHRAQAPALFLRALSVACHQGPRAVCPERLYTNPGAANHDGVS